MKLANKMITTFETKKNEVFDPKDKPAVKKALAMLERALANLDNAILAYSKVDKLGASELENIAEELADYIMHINIGLDDEDGMEEAANSFASKKKGLRDVLFELNSVSGNLRLLSDSYKKLKGYNSEDLQNISDQLEDFIPEAFQDNGIDAEMEENILDEKDVSKLTQVNSLRDKIKDRRNTIQGLKDQENKLRDKKQKLDDPVKRKPLQDQIDKLIASISDLEGMNREDQDKINKLKK